MAADPSQIGQVLLNLAVNARDAMADAAGSTIATRNEGETVVLKVSDNGTGMDADMRRLASSRSSRRRTSVRAPGLGLSTVYGIVTQSGGSIDVRSEPGFGATFTIRLPVTHAVETEPLPAEAVPAAGAERILVVDEKVVRDLLAQMLRRAGTDRGSGGLAREARALDGIVGPPAHRRGDAGDRRANLSSRSSDATCSFISGYDQEALVEARDALFLQKPFSRDATRTGAHRSDGRRVVAGSLVRLDVELRCWHGPDITARSGRARISERAVDSGAYVQARPGRDAQCV